MENFSSSENHLAQCGPKKETEGLIPQPKITNVMHRKCPLIYMERDDVKSLHESKQTQMVSRTTKHPFEKPVNLISNRYWVMWVIYTYTHIPMDSILLNYDFI